MSQLDNRPTNEQTNKQQTNGSNWIGLFVGGSLSLTLSLPAPQTLLTPLRLVLASILAGLSDKLAAHPQTTVN